MNKELSDQVNTVERALGECMIETATTVIRVWLNELGENNPYEEALLSIHKRYQDLFTRWLNVDDPEAEQELDKLTGDMYQLADAVYVDIRLKRGLSPQMHGFNPKAVSSVLNYFQNCIQLKQEDLQWLEEAMRDPQQTSAALIAITALTRNLRECFSEEAILTLIEGLDTEVEVVANHCMLNLLSLLIHYDVRIDFFPNIQEAFESKIALMEEDGNRAFEMLCTLVEFSKKTLLEDFATGLMPLSWLPESLQKLVQASGIQNDVNTFYSWVPKAEVDYMTELVNNLPGTWLYQVVVGNNSEKEKVLVHVAVQCGYRDYMWAQPAVAGMVYRNKLREGAEQPIDFINYAHCLLLKGDRMMAFENYKLARQACGSIKDFYALFRPDRRALVDHGVPMDFVYFIEDNLVKG